MRQIVRKLMFSLNKVPYSGPEKCQMNFLTSKLNSAHQEDLIMYHNGHFRRKQYNFVRARGLKIVLQNDAKEPKKYT